MTVRVGPEPFNPGAELDAFTFHAPQAGAVVSFSGIVRNDGGDLTAMEIEHYPGMTERALEDIEAEARTRWDLTDSLIIHRHGHLRPGEVIMMVATASRHRADAFAAAEFLMDYLKSRAPFWKKEIRDGATSWVEARDVDEAALKRW
jgi:molybdopterin synthase catalytic subunit